MSDTQERVESYLRETFGQAVMPRERGWTAAESREWFSQVAAEVAAIVRAEALADCKAGIEAAADNRPAIMNPDTMRHIAANVGLWADHQHGLRAAARSAGPDTPTEGDAHE